MKEQLPPRDFMCQASAPKVYPSLSLPPSLARSELQAIELTAIVQQNSLLCGMVFSLATETLMIFHVFQRNRLYSAEY